MIKHNRYIMLLFIILTALATGSAIGECQEIKFTYDEAGNRIKREAITIVEVDTKDKDMNRFMNGNHLTEDITVTPDKNRGSIHIDIKDNGTANSHHVNIYSIAGYMVLDKPTQDRVFDIDINHLPNGIYILVISSDENSDAWKLDYKR